MFANVQNVRKNKPITLALVVAVRLMAFDNYTPYAMSTLYPRPDGQMPRTPAKDALEAALRDIGSLVSETTDWCEDQDGKTKSKRP